MNSLQHFSEQLKRATLRNKQNKSNIQTTTKVATVVSTSTPTNNKTKLTEEQYRNILVAKAITYIRGQA